MEKETRNESELCPELEILADEVGKIVHHWGFKSIHGRLWTHIFLADTPVDAGELTRRLRVSKALISLSLNDLLDYDVIRPAGRSERGTQVYQTNPNLLELLFAVLKSRERGFLSGIRTAQQKLLDHGEAKLTALKISSQRAKSIGLVADLMQLTLDQFLSFQDIKLGAWAQLSDLSSLSEMASTEPLDTSVD